MTPEDDSLFKNKIHISNIYNDKPFLYVLFLNDKIVYVGQTVNLQSRIKAHTKGLYSKKFDYYSFISFSDLKHLYNSIDDAEADYICKYKPIYNKTIPKNNLWISFKKISKLIYSISGNHMKVRKLIKLNDRLEKTTFKHYEGGFSIIYYNTVNLLNEKIINPIEFRKILK